MVRSHTTRRRENELVRVAFKWKPRGKRPRGRPGKRRIDVVEEDSKNLGIESWRETAQDRDGWRTTTVGGQNSWRVETPEEEEDILLKNKNRYTTWVDDKYLVWPKRWLSTRFWLFVQTCPQTRRSGCTRTRLPKRLERTARFCTCTSPGSTLKKKQKKKNIKYLIKTYRCKYHLEFYLSGGEGVEAICNGNKAKRNIFPAPDIKRISKAIQRDQQ